MYKKSIYKCHHGILYTNTHKRKRVSQKNEQREYRPK